MCPCLCPFYFLSVSFLYFCFLPSPSLMDPFTLQNERQDSYLHYRRSWILCTLMTFLKFPYLAILFLWSIRIDRMRFLLSFLSDHKLTNRGLQKIGNKKSGMFLGSGFEIRRHPCCRDDDLGQNSCKMGITPIGRNWWTTTSLFKKFGSAVSGPSSMRVMLALDSFLEKIWASLIQILLSPTLTLEAQWPFTSH